MGEYVYAWRLEVSRCRSERQHAFVELLLGGQQGGTPTSGDGAPHHRVQVGATLFLRIILRHDSYDTASGMLFLLKFNNMLFCCRSDVQLSNFQYNVSGYVAPRFHHSPPSPLDTSVHILSTNKQDWFVRVFHKRPTQRRALKHHAALMASLDKAGECGDGSSVLIANYDHPHHHPSQRRHRHSEVWVRRVPCSSFGAL